MFFNLFLYTPKNKLATGDNVGMVLICLCFQYHPYEDGTVFSGDAMSSPETMTVLSRGQEVVEHSQTHF